MPSEPCRRRNSTTVVVGERGEDDVGALGELARSVDPAQALVDQPLGCVAAAGLAVDGVAGGEVRGPPCCRPCFPRPTNPIVSIVLSPSLLDLLYHGAPAIWSRFSSVSARFAAGRSDPAASRSISEYWGWSVSTARSAGSGAAGRCRSSRRRCDELQAVLAPAEVSVDELHRHRAFPDGGGAPLDRARTDVTGREDPGNGGLEQTADPRVAPVKTKPSGRVRPRRPTTLCRERRRGTGTETRTPGLPSLRNVTAPSSPRFRAARPPRCGAPHTAALELQHEVVGHRLVQVASAMQQRNQCAASRKPDRRLAGRVSTTDHAHAFGAAELRLRRAGGEEDARAFVLGQDRRPAAVGTARRWRSRPRARRSRDPPLAARRGVRLQARATIARYGVAMRALNFRAWVTARLVSSVPLIPAGNPR